MLDNPMDLNLAVFNGHVNDADARAREIMRRTMPKMFDRLVEIEEEQAGIMGIFNVPPEAATMIFAGAVLALVNDGDRVPPVPATPRKLLGVRVAKDLCGRNEYFYNVKRDSLTGAGFHSSGTCFSTSTIFRQPGEMAAIIAELTDGDAVLDVLHNYLLHPDHTELHPVFA